MRTRVQNSAQLGELVAEVFDQAAQFSTDPEEVARLAAEAVARILRRARRTSHLPTPRPAFAKASAVC